MPATLLKLLTPEPLEIDACDGTKIIVEAKDLFTAGIDADFRNWGADEKGSATDVAKAQVYEMAQDDATFAQMFNSFSLDPEKHCFTQHQIINFVGEHRQWLRTNGYATFFLFKSKGNFFVAHANVYSDGRLYVRVYRLELDYVWIAEGYRVVVPA